MREPALTPVICLMGPTASGKTPLALALREILPVDIVSVDASQVYRGMDIGTAKPTPTELARTPHRLIDIRDPAQPYSAAEFCVDVQREIKDIVCTGRTPLLVGGTMFYFHALEFGLSDLPAADPDLRRRLTAEAAAQGWPALHARLVKIDAEAGRRIGPRDGQRIQRALEIHELTGQSPSLSARRRPHPRFHFIKIALVPDDRAALHARIAQRFHGMLKRGLIAEVEALYQRTDLHPGLPSVRTVGYRQAWKYLTTEINYYEMTEKAISATRQLAKRQLTWLRRYPDVKSFETNGAVPLSRCIEYLLVTKKGALSAKLEL